ncbi:hypothetical protein SERLADRAFT_463951 [Serpula lacrymans var. lacrymans S7.9]|uniref:Uncharacterized protein n=1 Tax=Serpula lacrymans var. lacrymans (strain S7.9) TaxID=578457 RepID=F8NQW8_SERL9|nr:uncharacterized protein SERLADRAFT_463951 [Serpula lacrymans var. lacrymans S7.9]EGO26671.1 hypothetical protein SERLADRAFT_463951 [Serpula lacrymans var. lacrymans S7.9]
MDIILSHQLRIRYVPSINKDFSVSRNSLSNALRSQIAIARRDSHPIYQVLHSRTACPC